MFSLIYTEFLSRIIRRTDTRIEGNRLSVETEIPEIRATRDLMKVCSKSALSLYSVPAADCISTTAAVIMHAHAARM